MAFNRVRNIFDSLLTLFSCISKNAKSDCDSEMLPSGPRSAPPPSPSTGAADPVQQNTSISDTSTDDPLADVPSRDEPTLPTTASSQKGGNGDVSGPQIPRSTRISTSDAPAITSTPSGPQTEYIPVTVPGNVSEKLWNILNMAYTKPHPRRREGVLTFTPPILSDDDFGLRVLQKRVSLETVTVSTDSVTGYIRVLNRSYVKRVAVRYTVNKWHTYVDVEAEWFETVEEGEMDRFLFTLPAPDLPGELTLAVRYDDNWDNNEERNYTILFESVQK